MRRGCQVVLFGKPQAPVRDNLDEAREDAKRLGLGQYDDDGYFYLDGPADFAWVPIHDRQEAA
jgi:hypothetical protein